MLSFYSVITNFRDSKRALWQAAIILTTLVSALSTASGLQQVVPTSTLVANGASIVRQGASVPATQAAATTVVPTPVAPSVAAPQDCEAPSYSLPSQINLTDKANGLTQIIDAPTRYQLYGNTSAQIKVQLQDCAPPVSSTTGEGGSFAAETGGNLVWQYSTTSDGSGTCVVSNVKVGMHINMILPSWTPSASATSGLASNWQTYISSLTTHENGHVAIYQQYASKLLSDLQSVSASDCDSIAANVATKASADLAALGAANDAYDAATNHGAKQGAVLR